MMIDQAARNRLQQDQLLKKVDDRLRNQPAPQVIVQAAQPTELMNKIGALTDTIAKTQTSTPRVVTPAESLAQELRALQQVIGSGNLIATLESLGKNLNSFELNSDAVNNLQGLINDLSSKIKVLSTLQAQIPTSIAVKLNKNELSGLPVSGQVDVGTINSLPPVTISNIAEFSKEVSQLVAQLVTLQSVTVKAIQGSKTEFPDAVTIKNEVQVQDMGELLDRINETNRGINMLLNKEGQSMDGPMQVEIVKEPVRMIPQPVTKFDINPLRGEVTTTGVTVGTTATPLPATALAKRRSIVIFNNHATITLYIGGSGVTNSGVAIGLPVLAQTYSPVIDAGPQMIIYGIAASSSVTAITLEASNDYGTKSTSLGNI